ncbi:MAG: hypothetical protein AB7R55_15130, partial [Gemmatimonadales bacterium]
MRRRLDSAPAWLAVSTALAACGTGPPPGQATRDSAGIILAESTQPVHRDRPLFRIDPTPTIDLGGEGDPRREFARIAVQRLSDGRLVIVDGPSRELRWFHPDGRWIRTVGRQGGGPGEFRQLELVRGFVDTVAIFDLALRRLSLFDTAARYLGGTPLPSDGALSPVPIAGLSGGRLLLRGYPEALPGVEGFTRFPVTLLVASITGDAVRQVGTFPDHETVVTQGPDGYATSRVLFARMAAFAAAGTSILVATNDSFGFDVYAPDGRLERRVRRPFEPRIVREADVEAFIEWAAARVPEGQTVRRARLRDYYRMAPRPERMPPLDRLLVAADGLVWVRRYHPEFATDQPGHWSVFDSRGRWLTEVETPAGLDVESIDGRSVLGTWADELGLVH